MHSRPGLPCVTSCSAALRPTSTVALAEKSRSNRLRSISGLARAPFRPLLYVSAWLMTLIYAWQVLTHASAG